MKKIAFSLIAVALFVASCGPSAKELETKRIADSTFVADSIAREDSIAKVKFVNDSIAKADSIAKISKSK
jgi:hypothetical protein